MSAQRYRRWDRKILKILVRMTRSRTEPVMLGLKFWQPGVVGWSKSACNFFRPFWEIFRAIRLHRVTRLCRSPPFDLFTLEGQI